MNKKHFALLALCLSCLAWWVVPVSTFLLMAAEVCWRKDEPSEGHPAEGV